MTRLYSLGYVEHHVPGHAPLDAQESPHMLDESEDDIRDPDSEEAKQILTSVQKELCLRRHRRRLDRSRSGLRHRDRVHAADGDLRAHPARQLSPGPDHRERLRAALPDRLQPHRRLLLGRRIRPLLALCPRRIPALALGATGTRSRFPRSFSNLDQIPYSGSTSTKRPSLPALSGAESLPPAWRPPCRFMFSGMRSPAASPTPGLGPAQGGALAWSNNAENIYSFRINRVEPLHIPCLLGHPRPGALRLLLRQPQRPYRPE